MSEEKFLKIASLLATNVGASAITRELKVSSRDVGKTKRLMDNAV